MTDSELATLEGHTDGAVELTVPAEPAYVSVLRTVTASLAARRDFTIEEIDDLRIAVDEASALLLPRATSTSQLSASFAGSSDTLRITVTISPATPGPEDEIDPTEFAWMVLAALTDEVSTRSSDGALSVTLSKKRAARS